MLNNHLEVLLFMAFSGSAQIQGLLLNCQIAGTSQLKVDFLFLFFVHFLEQRYE